jgi:signal transduction histidine kinase
MKNYGTHVTVEVVDNGKGFDLQRLRPVNPWSGRHAPPRRGRTAAS